MIWLQPTKFFKQLFERYLNRTQPPASQVTLQQNRIYILPSRLGCWFGLLIVLLYLLGTNYQNNLILITAFMLISLFLVTMLQSFYNLYRLHVKIVADAECFAGQDAFIEITLNSEAAQMLQLGFFKHKGDYLAPLVKAETHLALPLPALSRGCYELPRLKIASHYPFGLFRCWSYPALQAKIWIYPTPLQTQHIKQPVNDSMNRPASALAMPEADWLKNYQTGDLPARILWKKLAANPNMTVVRYAPPTATEHEQWIQVPSLTGIALETALCEATAKLISLEKAGQAYGMILPNQTIAPARGAAHYQRCLQELALC